MELHNIAFRCIFAFLFLLALTRFAGNRTAGQGSLFDFVLALIMGDLIDNCIWGRVPASQFVVAAGTLVLIHIIVEIGCAKSERLERLIGADGKIFMRDGKLIRGTLRREMISELEVEWMLRREGLERENWHRIKESWIEANGRPGVILHEWEREIGREDLEETGR